jgi:CubicO group peptidase (beta-lactamase class C family)
MTEALAAEKPWWKPGRQHGYHARTYGWLLGEVVQRVCGKSVGAYFKDEIADPLGLDFHIGLDDRHHHRVASITPLPPSPPEAAPNFYLIFTTQPDSMTTKAFLNPPNHLIPDCPNTAEWRQAELPAANGHGTARSLARLYGALACGGRLEGVHVLSPETIELGRTEHSRGPDQVLRVETRFALGFMMPVSGLSMGPNDRAFGHSGAGGSIGFADPEAGIGFGYVMNKTRWGILGDIRAENLIKALYESL